jgi:hypothetical protein
MLNVWKNKIKLKLIIIVAVLAVFILITCKVANVLNKSKSQTVCAVVENILSTRVRDALKSGKFLTSAQICNFSRDIVRPNNKEGLIYADNAGNPLDSWGRTLRVNTITTSTEICIIVTCAMQDGQFDTDDDYIRMSTLQIHQFAVGERSEPTPPPRPDPGKQDEHGQ